MIKMGKKGIFMILLILLLFPFSLISYPHLHDDIDTLQDVDWRVVAGAAVIHVQRPLEDYFISPDIQEKTLKNLKWYASVVTVETQPSVTAPFSLQQLLNGKYKIPYTERDWCEEGRKCHTIIHTYSDASGESLINSLSDLLDDTQLPSLFTFLSEDKTEIEMMKQKIVGKGVFIFSGIFLQQKQWYNYKKNGPLKWWLNR